MRRKHIFFRKWKEKLTGIQRLAEWQKKCYVIDWNKKIFPENTKDNNKYMSSHKLKSAQKKSTRIYKVLGLKKLFGNISKRQVSLETIFYTMHK